MCKKHRSQPLSLLQSEELQGENARGGLLSRKELRTIGNGAGLGGHRRGRAGAKPGAEIGPQPRDKVMANLAKQDISAM